MTASVTDIRGAILEFDSPVKRVVSLVPSLTETVVELGCADRLAGVTKYCLDIEGLGEIETVGGVWDIDTEAIRALAPDVVLAGREENRKRDIEEIEKSSRVYVCEPRSVMDIQLLLNDLGRMLDAIGPGWDWSERLQSARAELCGLVGEIERVRFAYLVWWDPPMVAGADTYISNLLEVGPFENVFGKLNGYPRISEDDLYGTAMDVIFLPSEPYEFSDKLRWKIASRAKAEKVEAVDGRMCGWYGTRTVKGLQYMTGLARTLGGERG